jgi:hypothetical protein
MNSALDTTPPSTQLAEHAPPITRWKALAAILMLAAAVAILAFAMTGSKASNRDFVCYWAAGHQLAHHANPYDGPAILRLERTAGFLDSRPFFMRNPPIAFFLALPLGFVDTSAGAVLWSLALIAALMGSIRMLWILHGRPDDRLHLMGYCFPPAVACLLAGQTGIFLLLGVVLFLYLHDSQPCIAGACLLLCALKPQLFLPCCVALVAWIAINQAYRILAGAVTALLASLALAWFLDPSAWSQYAQMVRAARLQDEFIPTLSLAFRLVVHRSTLWLQFGPVLVACVWAALYFWKHRLHWNWVRDGSLLLLVSVLTAPYAWFTDEAIVLPAILVGLYRASNAGRSMLPFGCIAGIALIEVLAGTVINSGFYIWTAPAWFAWYVYSVNPKQTVRPDVTADSPACLSPTR